MTQDNSAQIDFWNGPRAEAWARHADTMDRIFTELTEVLLAAAEIAPGDRVLDLGCGGGGTTLRIAETVGPAGAVTGIDISAPMLRIAGKRMHAAGHANAAVIRADGAAHPFERGAFDALVSRFGCMFFEDPADAFGHIRSALAPGARIALAVWREPRENPWAMAPVSAVREFIDMPPRPGPEEPGPFAFADPERVHRVLGGAGLADVALTPADFALPLGRTLDEALAFSMEMGPLSGPLAEAEGTARDKAVAAVREVLAANRGDDGAVRLAGACWIVTARAP